MCQEWKISRLTFEYDSEPFGKERDAAIKKLAMEAGVEVIVKISHTLYDLDKWGDFLSKAPFTLNDNPDSKQVISTVIGEKRTLFH